MSRLENGIIDEDIIGLISNYIGVMNYDPRYIGTFIYGYKKDGERFIEVISISDNDEMSNTFYNKIGDANISYTVFSKDYLADLHDLATCDILYDKTGLISEYQKLFRKENYMCYRHGQIIFENTFLYLLKSDIADATYSGENVDKKLKKNLLLTNFYEYLLDNNAGIGNRSNSALRDDSDRIDLKVIPFDIVNSEEHLYALATASYRKTSDYSKNSVIAGVQKKLRKEND